MNSRVTGESLAPFQQLINDMRQAFKEKDARKAMRKFVADDDVLSFGFLADISSKSELEQHWHEYFDSHSPDSQGKENYTVYVYGEAACLCLTYHPKSTNEKIRRLTLFLENHSGAWLIRHRHHSYAPQ